MALEDYFYKYNENLTEGFIGDNKDLSIVFILREPNSSNKESNKFWFKEIVENGGKNQKGKKENTYFPKLGKVACLLLDELDKCSALKKCIYINLNPEKGGSNVGISYSKVLSAFSKKQNTELPNRWEIINKLPDGCRLVTVKDIYNAIKNNVDYIENKNDVIKIKNQKFSSFSFENEEGSRIEVFSIYHPKARGRYAFTEDDITYLKARQ